MASRLHFRRKATNLYLTDGASTPPNRSTGPPSPTNTNAPRPRGRGALLQTATEGNYIRSKVAVSFGPFTVNLSFDTHVISPPELDFI